MHFNHDERQRVSINNVDSGVEVLEDGHLAAWASFDVDADAWAAWQAKLEAAGATGGMSFTMLVPIGNEDESTDVFLAGDAAHFDDSTPSEAAACLQRFGDVQPQRLYQFAFEPQNVVIIGLLINTVVALGPNLAAAALWDATKLLWNRRAGSRRTRFTIDARAKGSSRQVKLLIAAQDEASLRTALDKGCEILSGPLSGIFDFNPNTDGYDQLAQSVDDQLPNSLE